MLISSIVWRVETVPLVGRAGGDKVKKWDVGGGVSNEKVLRGGKDIISPAAQAVSRDPAISVLKSDTQRLSAMYKCAPNV